MATLREQCTTAIKAAMGDTLSDQQVKDATDKLVARTAQNKRMSSMLNDGDAKIAAAKQLADDEKVARLIELRSRSINVLRKKERLAHYEANVGDETNAIQALIVGVESPKFGYASSTEALQHAERSRLITGLGLELERSGIAKQIGSFDRATNLAVMQEMSRATGGSEAATGNKAAETVGKIYAKWLELARVRRNDAGAWTRSLEGFITPQAHDVIKVRGSGKEADYIKWRDYVGTRLDERTFNDIGPDPKAREQYLRDTWNSLATGVHLKSTESDWLGGFKGGTQNTAKRASQERSLHFKSAEAFFDYNEKFGPGSVHEAVVGTLDRAARDTALMKKWGTNPQAALAADVDQLLKAAKERGDLAQIDALSGKTMAGRRMLAMMGQIDGTANIPGSATLARIGRNIRGYETITKLTGTLISSFADLPARARALEWHGQGFFEGLGSGLKAVFTGRGDLETRELLHRIGSASDGIAGDIASRFDAADRFDGRMAKLVRLDMVLNGQKYWTDVLLNQSTKDIASTLGFYKNAKFGELPELLRTNLKRFGLTEDHWDYARANTVADSAGRAHVVSDSIRFEPDEAIAKMIGKTDASPVEMARFKDKFEDTWRGYFVTSTREAMTEPTAMAKYLVTAGTAPGTTTGEIMRFLSQFKSFSTQFVVGHLNRELNRAGSAQVGGLIKLIVSLTAAGYISGMVKDLAALKSPKSPEDASGYLKLITDAFVRGGGMGILGDVIFADWQKSQGGGWNLLGPAAGSFGDIMSLAEAGINKAAGTHDTHLLARTEQVVSNHIPFVNLFYSKQAWNFLVLHGLQEAANPGYLGRMQRRMERENHQHLLVPTIY